MYHNRWLSILLTPISWIYAVVVIVRNALFDYGIFCRYRSSLPVICIGNITVGGTGKSPLVISVVKQLRARGYSPVILSRGYKSRLSGPHIVERIDPPGLVGDEPLMFASMEIAPVVISRRRAEGVRLIEQHKIGDVVVLDDAFQHRWLHSDINLLCVAARNNREVSDLLDGLMLPAGRLREPLQLAKKRVDIVVLSSRLVGTFPNRDSVSRVERYFGGTVPVFTTALAADGVFSLCGGESSIDKGKLRAKATLEIGPVVTVCAIAQPEAFIDSVVSLGFKIEKSYQFLDHKSFKREEVVSIRESHPDLPILCTVKDGVKLGQLGVPGIYELRTSLDIEPSGMFELILKKLPGRGGV